MEPAPPIDRRTATDVASQIQDLLAEYAPDWRDLDPAMGRPQGISKALIAVFARFAEILIERLNQVPDRNFLAFLDLLGVSRLSPQPARVPLTFALANGTLLDAIVPPETQVAAPPAEGERDPVVFETERELVVTAAQLTAIFVRNPGQDTYGDRSSLITATSSVGVPAFRSEQPIEHIFYLGHRLLFSLPYLIELRLDFVLEALAGEGLDHRDLQWEIWDGKAGIPIRQTATPDDTANLITTGTVVFANLPQIPQQDVHAISSRWLRCRLLTPITRETQPRTGMVRASQLPRIREITMGVSLNRSGLVIDRAFTNQLPLDLSRDFLIFGEKPRFTDVFNLANREAFSQSDAVINLQVELTAADTGIPPPKPSANLKLQWEFWDGKAWLAIGTTTPAIIPESPDAPTIPAIAQAAGTNRFADETEALTKTGAIHFTFPAPPAATTVNGVKSFWLRVRIVSGNYGEEARYEPDTTDTTPPRPEYRLIPATFAPPSISSITVDYELTRQGEAPEVILTQNDFAYTNVTHPVNQANQSFSPFQATQDTHPTLYLGFTLPAGREDFPNRNLSLFNCSAEPTDAQGPVPLALGGNEDNPRLSWEYFNGQTWHTLIVLDETDALRRSGLLEVLPPADFASSTEFGLRRYWLRVRWVSGAYRVEPRLQRVLLNTTLATQTRTLGNEILGSGNGTAGQIFRTVQAPVLPGQQLEVREPELPAAEEQEALRQAPGEAGIASVLDAAGRPREVWIRWQEVPDFYGSGPHDRHYVLDHLNGEVRFGDGLHGRIPPVDTGNIRMTRYQIGGGATGNRPANTVVQLLTTVPFVDSVINPEPATGGADMETLEALRERGPTLLRHRHRVVTLEDYEDLAKMASPAVARAKCVPLRDLVADPLGQFSRPGAVSVIVVPQATAARPLPSRELLRRVQDYLEANVLPTATIAVVGPLYITVSVSVELTLVALQGASAVEQAVQQALARFLHPLTGGPQGTGWAFGRQPQKSDFYALLEAIAGVDYVRTLEVAVSEDLPGSEATGRFLINSGRHRIDLVFEG